MRDVLVLRRYNVAQPKSIAPETKPDVIPLIFLSPERIPRGWLRRKSDILERIGLVLQRLPVEIVTVSLWPIAWEFHSEVSTDRGSHTIPSTVSDT